MAAEIKRNYLRLVRRAYRYLRNPRLKKHRWLQAILKPLFNHEYWHPCRDTVAGGLSIGLFCSQLPVPGQMLIAALFSAKARVNIPISIAACWITNPITQIPIWLFQERFGEFLITTLGVPVHPILEKLSVPFFVIQGEKLGIAPFIIGFLAAGAILSLLAYPVVYTFSALLPKLLPKTRYQRARAKVIAARKKEEKIAAKN